MPEAEETDNPVDGIIIYGSRPIGIAVACRLVRRLGCVWPIEIWFAGDLQSAAKFETDTAVFPNTGSVVEALRGSHFDRAVVLDDHTYPVALPCRLLDEAGDAAFVYWDHPDVGGPLVIDRRAATDVIACGEPWSARLAADVCSHKCAGNHTKIGSSDVFSVDGVPRLVRRRHNLFTYWDGLHDPRVPLEPTVAEILNEVLRGFPSRNPS